MTLSVRLLATQEDPGYVRMAEADFRRFVLDTGFQLEALTRERDRLRAALARLSGDGTG